MNFGSPNENHSISSLDFKKLNLAQEEMAHPMNLNNSK